MIVSGTPKTPSQLKITLNKCYNNEEAGNSASTRKPYYLKTMKLTKEQQTVAKEELLSTVWGDLENNWKDYLTVISESVSEEFDLDVDEVYSELRENLDCQNLTPKEDNKLTLSATYK